MNGLGWTWLLGVVCVLLLALAGTLAVWLRRVWARMSRLAELCRRIPWRSYVLTETGRVLLDTEAVAQGGRPAYHRLAEIPELNHTALMAALHAASVSKEEQQLESPSKDGRTLDCRLIPLEEEAFLLTVQERTESAAETRAAERLVRWIVESAGEGILVTDASGEVRQCNAAAMRLAGIAGWKGRKAEELLRIYSPSTGMPVPLPLSGTLADGAARQSDGPVEVRGAGGERHQMLLHSTALQDADGHARGAVLMLCDVTSWAHKKAELHREGELLHASLQLGDSAAFIVRQPDLAHLDLHLPSHFWPRGKSGEALTPQEWVLPEDLQAFLRGWKRLLAGEQEEISLTYRVQETGPLRCFDMRVRAAASAVPGQQDYYGFLQHTTGIRSGEMQMRRKLQLLETLLDALPGAVFAKDVEDDFRYLYCNRAFTEFLGVDRPEKALGHIGAELLGHTSAAGRIEADEQLAVSTNRLITSMMSFDGRDGKPRTEKVFQRLATLPDGRRILACLRADFTAEEAQRLRERSQGALLQEAVDALPFSVVVREASGARRYLAANRYFLVRNGVFREDVVGYGEGEVKVAEDLGQVADAPAPKPILQKIAGRTGGNFIFERRQIPLPDGADGGRVLVVSREVTAEQQARNVSEALIRCLNGVMLAENFDVRCERLFSSLTDFFRCDYLACWQVSGHLNRCKRLYAWSSEASDDYWQNDQVAWVRIFQRLRAEFEAGRCQLVPDVAKSMLAAEFAAAGMKSLALAPVLVEGRIWGVAAMLYRSHRHAFNAAEEEALQENATILSQAVHQEQQLQALYLQKQQLQVALDTLALPFWVYDAQGRRLYSNAAAEAVARPCPPEVGTALCRARQCPEYTRCATLEALERHREVRGRRRNEGEALRVLAHPVMDAADNCLCVVVCGIEAAGESSTSTQGGEEQVPETGGSTSLMLGRSRDSATATRSTSLDGVSTGPLPLHARALPSSSTTNVGSDGAVVLMKLEADGSVPRLPSVPARLLDTPEFAAHTSLNRGGGRILLVDDVSMNLDVLAALLQQIGFSACKAGSAAAALEAFAKEPFELVMTDLWMPGQNGSQLAEELRKRDHGGRLRIFAVTADVEAQRNFRLDQFDATFIKPLTGKSVAQVILKCFPPKA